MSPAPVARSDSTEQEILAANQRFYAAFESLDIAAMEKVWLQEDWVQCVHPGWNLLMGWEEVRESWVRIFATTQRLRLALSSLWVHVQGEVAWVACTEHMTSLFEGDFDDSLVQATNMFILHEGAWMMVAHHASPLPAASEPSVQ